MTSIKMSGVLKKRAFDSTRSPLWKHWWLFRWGQKSNLYKHKDQRNFAMAKVEIRYFDKKDAINLQAKVAEEICSKAGYDAKFIES